MKALTKAFLVILAFGISKAGEDREFGVVEDFVDIEPENYRQTHLFEDFSYELFDRQVFLRKTTKEFRGLIAFYQDGLKKIFLNKELNDKNVGPELVGLLGNDFDQFYSDIKDIEIKIKAYVEKEINMFFLYKCQNQFFSDHEKLPKCDRLKLEVRNYLMFKNFFQFGYLNEINSLLFDKELGSAFEEAFLIKLEELKINFKLPMTLIWFVRDQMTKTILRKISKRFGSGIKIQIVLKTNEEQAGNSSQQNENENGNAAAEESQGALEEMIKTAEQEYKPLDEHKNKRLLKRLCD